MGAPTSRRPLHLIATVLPPLPAPPPPPPPPPPLDPPSPPGCFAHRRCLSFPSSPSSSSSASLPGCVKVALPTRASAPEKRGRGGGTTSVSFSSSCCPSCC